ncbi:MAG: hypothetical protein Q4D64_10710, partial [Prevotellaceae bacterium]|nr:hypothetical protein [Prevotellaceae bacterium]
KGEYLFFWDSDDYIYQNSIELLINASKKYNLPDMVVGNYYDEFHKNNNFKFNKYVKIKHKDMMSIGENLKLTPWTM